MYMDEAEFRTSFGTAFDAAMSEAKSYVEDAGKLRNEIARWEACRDRDILQAPFPDQFLHRMMQYRGFVRHPDRLKNWILSKANHRGETSPHLPIMMDIEPDSRCNFRCIMCARAKRGVGAKSKPRLTFEEFKQIIDTNMQFVEVKLQGIGEPLLNHDLFAMIRYATHHDIWVRSTINGSLLHKNDNFKKLIDSGIGEVQLSFDGATKEVFEKIRLGANFDQILTNIKQLNDYVRTKDRDFTRMWVLLQQNNRFQFLDFIELAARLGFRRLTYSMVLTGWGEEECFDSLKTGAFTNEEEAAILTEARKYGIEVSTWNCTDRYRLDSLQTLCAWPFSRAFLTSDSRIMPCGLIGYRDDINFGSALHIREAWNAEPYRNFRRAHIEGNIPSFCRECYETNPEKFHA